MHEADFDIDAFKSYYKDVWTYFGKYIGLFDMDREDLRIVCYLNRIDTMLHCKTPVGLNSCEWNTCICLHTHSSIRFLHMIIQRTEEDFSVMVSCLYRCRITPEQMIVLKSR